MASYDKHDIVSKLRSAPGQFDEARMKADAAEEIEALRSTLRNAAERENSHRSRRKSAAAFSSVTSFLGFVIALVFTEFFEFSPEPSQVDLLICTVVFSGLFGCLLVKSFNGSP
ncbi:hypothetical protein [Dinoroseobacter sp. S124A]|uniref:hypothetical protein n=1 Tax=Dinoroseobacter sp. S124A TaxID=3415128 RepID=UPI003C7C1992